MLQLRHGVVHTLLPRRDVVLLAGGRGRQLVPTRARLAQEKRHRVLGTTHRLLGPPPSPLHAEQLQGLPGCQALELVPHDLGLRGE